MEIEGCSKSSAGAAYSLPDELLVEILSRVPAKSVCRFKCVSKAWRDLIADTDNRKKLRQPMQGLFVQTPEFNGNELARFIFNCIDLRGISVPLDIDPCFSFLTDMTGIKIFLDSCNGLIVFEHFQGPSLGAYIVCNPTTKQWLQVPACGCHQAVNHTYLAFDPTLSSHFHLVQFQIPHLDSKTVSLHVYSSETGTWSQNQIDKRKEQGQLEGWHHHFTLDAAHDLCAFVNGFLHLLVWDSDVQHILVVDVQGKARRMITVPVVTDWRHGYACYLGQSQGKLHCVTRKSADNKSDTLSTWVLQDYDTQEWVLKSTVSCLDVFEKPGGWPEFQVIGIHQDCNVVFFIHQWSFELRAYNMDGKEVSVIATFKCRKSPPDFARYIPYFSESPTLTNKH